VSVMPTKQELLLPLPFDFLLSFACETKLVRHFWPNYTKKDLVHSLVRSLSEKHCAMLREEYDHDHAYESTAREILFELPTANGFRVNFISTIRSGVNGGVIVEELPLGGTRVDVAVFDGFSSAYELKGPRDTTDRLARQISMYSEVFEHVTVVSDGQGVDDLPDHVGVIEVERHGGRMSFGIRRRSVMNRKIDPCAQLKLLRLNDLQFLSNRIGRVSDNRAELTNTISRTISASEINQYYKSVMVAREVAKDKRKNALCAPTPIVQSRLYG